MTLSFDVSQMTDKGLETFCQDDLLDSIESFESEFWEPVLWSDAHWMGKGVQEKSLDLFKALLDCRMIGPSSRLSDVMSEWTFQDFFEHDECSLQRLRFEIKFPDVHPESGYLSYFKPYLAYGDDEYPGQNPDLDDEMILNHPSGLIKITFHRYDETLERLTIQAWAGPREYLDELLHQWIQDCLRTKVEHFLSPFQKLLDPQFKPDLRLVLMEHPLLKSTFSEYVLNQTLLTQDHFENHSDSLLPTEPVTTSKPRL